MPIILLVRVPGARTERGFAPGGEPDRPGALTGMADPQPRRFRGLPRRRIAGREVPVAEGFGARLLGLALLPARRAGPGLLIPRCASVHTFGMRFALDLIFFTEGAEVVAVRRAVPPNRFTRCRGAASVLEVPLI